MNILLIHQAFVSPHEAGGTRHYELAQHCTDHGHHFTIVASDVSYLSGERMVKKGGIISEQNIKGIHVLRVYTCRALHRSFVWRVITFVSFMLTSILAGLRVKHPDIVMGTSPPIFQAVSAWIIAKLRRCPFLLEIRDLWPDFAIDMGVLTNPLLIRLSRGLEKSLYRVATHIVVNSPAYRDYLLRQGISKRKITVIPNGVDSRMFTEQKGGQEFRRQWNLDGEFIVAYAGALGMANDIQMVLRAAKRLKHERQIHFLLVGDGKERENLECIAGDWGLKNVTFTGPLPKTEMPSVLSASDACLAILKDIPMFRTTYPNKVFDYMAATRPTVLAIDGVIRDVVENSNGGVFVPPGDPELLANAVLRLEKNRQNAKAMGLNARKYVTEHFERNEQARQFVRLVETFRK